jgi:AraC-like DNA-binding protein
MPVAVHLSEPDSLIHPIYARMLRMMLLQAGVDSDRVLAEAGLDWVTLMADDRHLSRDASAKLVLAAVAATGKPWLGLELGAQAPVSAHGSLGFAVVTAPDLAAMFAVLARYGALTLHSLVWSLQLTPQGATLQVSDRSRWGAANGFLVDAVMAATLRTIEAALGRLPLGIHVDLPMPSPAWAAQYQRFEPVAFRFGQPCLAFHVSAAALAGPCLGADPRAHANACRDCESVLTQRAGRSVAERVAGLLGDAIPGRYPQLEEVAALCGLAPRTLMRRLASEGRSFQTLLDEARRQRALWLLQQTGLSVEEIAAQLGYADTSNFSRTVRRWFGTTPRALRQSPGPAILP